MEIIGRKWVTGIGMMVSSTAMALAIIPFSIWELYILRFLISLGCIPIVSSPLVVDYTRPESLGEAFGLTFTISILGIIATTLL